MQTFESELALRVASLLQQRAALSVENSKLKQQMARLKKEKVIVDGKLCLSLLLIICLTEMVHMTIPYFCCPRAFPEGQKVTPFSLELLYLPLKIVEKATVEMLHIFLVYVV